MNTSWSSSRWSSLSVMLLLAAAGACGSSTKGQGAPDSGTPDSGAPDEGQPQPDGGADGTAIADAPAEPMPPLPPITPSALWPAAGAAGVCPDPTLRLTFDAPPSLGTAGKIQVWNAAAPATPVVVVDMAVATVSETIGGTVFKQLRPVWIDGNAAVVHVPAAALGFGKTFYVTVEPNAIIGPGGATAVNIADDATWRFTTAAAAPTDLTALAVAADGTATFCSVQGAVDALPAGNTAASTITIARGTYREVVYWAAKANVTLHGEDRKATIIAGVNNNNLYNSSRWRALVGIDNTTGVIVENLTIHNLTPQGGSQAEALRFGQCDKCIVRDADILSLQDTIQWNGRIYAKNLYVEGNVDYVWGNGATYFKNSEFKTVGRTGYLVQARNATGAANGYVFVDSKLTADPGIIGTVLGRIDAGMFPGSHVAYINCELGPHIGPGGWMITGAIPPATLRFWEFESRTPAGALVDTSVRVPGSKQLTAEEAAVMRDPAMVLNGWMPE